MTFKRDVAVIGGGGHVGLPLAIMFAKEGLRTLIYDISQPTVERIVRGEMPFIEEGAEPILREVLAARTLAVTHRPDGLEECRFIVLIVGTPVDEHLNPQFNAIHRALDGCLAHLRDGQVLILRSTLFPGITAHVRDYLRERGLNIGVAFCPERVAQGHSLREFRELPQIISAFDDATLTAVRELFLRFTKDVIEVAPMEAELAKLMTNAWRYIQFAAVNQFYMIANKENLDFDRILHACRHKYPRMAGMPGPGFAAGPCLVKDTMQLAAFCHNDFILGHSAMLINEGLPYHLVQKAKDQVNLREVETGILGMAFKAESDDCRDSLSYKLKKLLSLESRRVRCADPYVADGDLTPQDDVIARSKVLFVGVPHRRYRELQLPPDKIVIDMWNCLPRQKGQI